MVKVVKSWMGGSEDLLLCECGGEYLHQGQVRLYDREEDEEQTTVTTVGKGKVHIEIMNSDIVCNPSERRHGMVIAFVCEQCEEIKELTIQQQKGRTFIEWRKGLPVNGNVLGNVLGAFPLLIPEGDGSSELTGIPFEPELTKSIDRKSLDPVDRALFIELVKEHFGGRCPCGCFQSLFDGDRFIGHMDHLTGHPAKNGWWEMWPVHPSCNLAFESSRRDRDPTYIKVWKDLVRQFKPGVVK